MPRRRLEMEPPDRRQPRTADMGPSGLAGYSRDGHTLEIEFRRREVARLTRAATDVGPRKERFDLSETKPAQTRTRNETLHAGDELIWTGRRLNRRGRTEHVAELRRHRLTKHRHAANRFDRQVDRCLAANRVRDVESGNPQCSPLGPFAPDTHHTI